MSYFSDTNLTRTKAEDLDVNPFDLKNLNEQFVSVELRSNAWVTCCYCELQ